VCVPTPVDESLAPALGPLRAACGPSSPTPASAVIILTSTSYVGCTRDLVVDPLTKRGFTVGTDVFVAFAPERIDPGRAHYSQRVVPRVLGGMTPACVRRAAEVVGRVAPVHTVSSPEAAEFTKLLENSFRAVNIAFANEMESAATSMGIKFDEVVEAAATKPFGFMPFDAGVGVGGHCIPCDPHYLLWQLRRERMAAPVLQRAMESLAPGRDRRSGDPRAGRRGHRDPRRQRWSGRRHKPGAEDMRESPALEVLEAGAAAPTSAYGALIPAVQLHDGVAMVSVADADRDRFVIVHHASGRARLAGGPTGLDLRPLDGRPARASHGRCQRGLIPGCSSQIAIRPDVASGPNIPGGQSAESPGFQSTTFASTRARSAPRPAPPASP
jgi:nucleotide sugar dehydrogenase